MGELTPLENFEGINSFKASLGAKIYQFSGEYVLVNKKIMYFIWSKFVPFAKKVKLKILKKLRRLRNK